MTIENDFRGIYNEGIDACVNITVLKAQLTKDAVVALGLEGTTPESKEYLIRTEAEIKALTDLAEILRRLKI